MTGVPPTSHGAMTLLARSVLTSNATSIDLPGLDQSYQHLVVNARMRTDQASVLSACTMTFNGDGGGNYDRQVDRGAVAAASAIQTLAGTALNINGTGANATAGEFGAFSIVLWNYTDATRVKVFTGWDCLFGDTAGASARTDTICGHWRSTAAINRVTAQNSGGTTLVTGALLEVYGLA